mmetsp:Transcript_23216/g.53909  ORF Transcript_23216/g.53909 Transcript_23216/m.53909 type:complete len:244 (-) Transcript_23216:608-1339(-)
MSLKFVPMTVVGMASTITPVMAVNAPMNCPRVVTGRRSPKPTQHMVTRAHHIVMGMLLKSVTLPSLMKQMLPTDTHVESPPHCSGSALLPRGKRTTGMVPFSVGGCPEATLLANPVEDHISKTVSFVTCLSGPTTGSSRRVHSRPSSGPPMHENDWTQSREPVSAKNIKEPKSTWRMTTRNMTDTRKDHDACIVSTRISSPSLCFPSLSSRKTRAMRMMRITARELTSLSPPPGFVKFTISSM